MRRLALLALLGAIVVAPAACKRRRKVRAEPANAQLVSVLAMNDPLTAIQLVRGFYNLEGGAWRWTMKSFAVALRPPENSAQNGARLELKLTVPGVIVDKIGAVTVSATAGGRVLKPETYSQPGDYVYARDVPAAVLSGDGVLLEFAVDKALPISGGDVRELALIATEIGLAPVSQ